MWKIKIYLTEFSDGTILSRVTQPRITENFEKSLKMLLLKKPLKFSNYNCNKKKKN